jgi:hypothetical protein
MDNLDLACARLGQNVARFNSADRNMLTQALGVLETQGVYALFLFLWQKDGELVDICHAFLGSYLRGASLLHDKEDEPLEAISRLAESLDDLLLAHQLLRQALIYGRYHVREGEKDEV